MNPQHWVMVKLLWPKGQNRTVLTSARRCLLRAAPLELKDTGFQLLEKHRLPEVFACVQTLLAEGGMGLSEVLVVLPAPAMDEHSEPRYRASMTPGLLTLAAELTEVANKIPSAKLTSRLFNKSFIALDNIEQFMQTPEIVNIRTLLDKLSVFPHDRQREKGAKYVHALAKKVVTLTEQKE